jgi:tetratricopeptide (TPR) repeat protein
MYTQPAGAVDPSGGRSTGGAAPPRWAVVLACAVLAAAAFAPVLTNGFVAFDDASYVTANGWVRQGLTREGVLWALRGDGRAYWHPLTWLSLMLDVELFGVRPGSVHAVNLALHVLGASLLFLFLDRTTARRRPAAAVALLFVVHPLQVEAVAWAVERKTVLASALGMGALLAWARYAERPSWGRYLAPLALFSASLLAKPLLVTLPFLLLVLDAWPLGRTPLAAPALADAAPRRAPWARLAAEKLPMLAIGAAVAIAVRRSFPGITEVLPLGLRAANAVTSVWAYLGKIAWPAALAVYYPNPAHVPAWEVAAAIAGLALVSGALLGARGRLTPGPLAGWCWFLGTLVPVLGLVRNGLWPAMADRFAYFPLAGALVAAVWAAAALVQGSRRARLAAAAALALALVALAVRTRAQAAVWRSTASLFGNAVEVTPPSRFVWANYGAALQAEGRAAEARAWWERMVRVLPEAPDGHLNLGVALHEAGDLAGAEAAYRAALARDPRNAHATYDLALLDKGRGDLAGALAGFTRARDLGLRSGQVLRQIGGTAAALGRGAEAEDAYAEALRADPLDWRAAAGLAAVRAAAGRTAEADALLLDAGRRAVRAGEADAARRAGLSIAP